MQSDASKEAIMTETSTRFIAEMQQVTQEYASFSRSRSGLGNVLGGAAGLISFAALWLLGRGVALAALTVGLTVAWLVGKELIRRRFYRPFGDAREIWSVSQRRGQAIGAAAAGVGIAAYAVLPVGPARPITPPWSIPLPYLIVCVVTPWIVWRYLRTVNEAMVGSYLLFMSALTCAGLVPDRGMFIAFLPLYSVLLIVLGFKEHRRFQGLAARLRTRREV
jgi:hypothetical protein